MSFIARSKQPGFTIVELLIVIVVIGILAAITIVAYNGVQQRASNTQRISAVEAWVKSIKSYIALNQAYPAPLTIYCIGEDNIADFDSNADVDCGSSNNIKHNNSYTAIFNSGVKTITSLPSFPGKPVQYTDTIKGSGMLFRAYDTYTETGVTSYPTLIFFLEGSDQDCVLRPLATNGLGGNFTSTTAKNSSSSVGTACRVILPDPTNL